MTHVPTISPSARFERRTGRASFLETLGRLLLQAGAAIGDRHRRRRNRSALDSLTRAQLADIGLTRSGGFYSPLDGGPCGWRDLDRRL